MRLPLSITAVTNRDAAGRGRRTGWVFSVVVYGLAAGVALVLGYASKPAPAATAIAPGIGIDVEDSFGRVVEACTLGFLAIGADGAHYALTAGHCDRGGGVTMSHRTEGNLRKIGRFAHSVHEGEWGPDIAAIRLHDDELQRDGWILAERRVRGVTTTLLPEDTLCFDGRISGRQCGNFSLTLHAARSRQAMENLAFFTATAQPGDSGSPVYRLERDGSATAVGIVNGTVSDVGVVATLVEPYLEQWGLTLDTARP